jgi:UDP-N-acetylmuramate dehydrogenase
MKPAWKKEFQHYLDQHVDNDYLRDEPLSLHTWYRIGGPVDFFVYPRSVEALINLLEYCKTHDVRTYVLGEGANVLASDTGFRGAVINLTKYLCTLTHNDEHHVTAEAGVMLRELVLFCEKHQLGGIDFLAGIPGTVGGALMMNAGAYGGEIGDRVKHISLLEQCGPITIDASHIHFQYRNVPELQNHILLGCTLSLDPAYVSRLKTRRMALLKERAAKQPLNYPSCGSVFKRPPGYYVGKMVEDLGLKGFRCGNAMISEKHGGFIVNLGKAKASHVMSLIEKIRDEVYKHYHIQLEPEVKFLGFEK